MNLILEYLRCSPYFFIPTSWIETKAFGPLMYLLSAFLGGWDPNNTMVIRMQRPLSKDRATWDPGSKLAQIYGSTKWGWDPNHKLISPWMLFHQVVQSPTTHGRNLPIEVPRWMVSKAIDLCSARCLGFHRFFLACAKIPVLKLLFQGTANLLFQKMVTFVQFSPILRCFPNVKTCLESSGYNKFGSINLDN